MHFRGQNEQSVAGDKLQLLSVYYHSALTGKNIVCLLGNGMIMRTGCAVGRDNNMAEAVMLCAAYGIRSAQHFVYPFSGAAFKGIINKLFSGKSHGSMSFFL